MKYIRNGEIQREIGIFLLIWVGTVLLGYFSVGAETVLITAVTGVLYGIFHFSSSYIRYRRIAQLADKINRYLHGYMDIYIAQQKEGELAVLESEIAKMILRLRNQADLLRQDKIYLSDSIADISHQIRTPLTTMNLIVSRLSPQDLPDAKRKQLMMELEGMLMHIDWLIQSLLTISKLDAGTIHMQQVRVRVPELIRHATETLEIPMELRRQSLVVTCDPEVSFSGDLKWMKEALMNIVKNCMEHTPENGEIRICARENALYTEIVVEDNGAGIAKEDLPHLFERFYKGKNSSDKSVGIGLALAKMIINEQQGNVSAENAMKRGQVSGARFVIRFYKSVI